MTEFKLTDTFSVRRIPNNWVLIKKVHKVAATGKNKGGLIEAAEQSYFSTLRALLVWVLDHDIAPTGGIAELNDAMQEYTNTIIDKMDELAPQLGEAKKGTP